MLHARNEWAARLPSALFVLAVAIFFALGTRHILGARGSVIAALCWLTNLGMLEMGRSIEIEAVYISLFTVALIFWLVSWQQGRSPWLTWTVPWCFLGLGLLAKGPAHLFFFYALIFGVLRQTGRLREFIKLPHLVGIIVLLGVFGAWLVPYLLELRAQYPLQTWWYELSNIVRGDEISSQNWWLGFPRRLAYFLPWILLLPFIRLGKIADAHQREICRGLVWGSLVAFLVMLPWPGVRPRYILPLLAPFCWVIGVAVAADAFEWTIAVKRFRVRVSSKAIATFVALGAVVAIIVFPLRGATILRRSTKIRSLAAQINSAIPPGERLYAVNPRWQPYLFYVHAPITYLKTLDELPAEARYFLVTPENLAESRNKPALGFLATAFARMDQEVSRRGKHSLRPRTQVSPLRFRAQEPSHPCSSRDAADAETHCRRSR